MVRDARLRREDAEADLLLRHFEREEADGVEPLRRRPRIARLVRHGHRLGHVHEERRLTHRRTGGDDDQVLRLEPRGHFVEAVVAGGEAGDEAAGVLHLFDRRHVRARDAIECDEALLRTSFRDLVDRLLRDVQHFGRLARCIERGAHDRIAHHDEPAQCGLFFNDFCVTLDVRDVGDAVDQRRDVRGAADLIELPLLRQLFAQRQMIDLAALLGEVAHRREDRAVRVTEEIFRVDDADDAIEGVVVEEDRSEDRALRIRALGQGAIERDVAVELSYSQGVLIFDCSAQKCIRKFSAKSPALKPSTDAADR